MSIYLLSLHDALLLLNWNHDTGDIGRIELDLHKCNAAIEEWHGIVHRHFHGGFRDDKRTFRIVNGVLHFLRHRVKLA